MAVTQIWKVNNLKRVIDYTTNAEKTVKDISVYKEVHNGKEYDNLDYESEEQCFVSGINCSPKTAYKEMMITKHQFNKTGSIQGFHSFQSFKEGEVTPELAHKIGVKFASEMWGDRFEVVVSTHLNTDHIHNHFVINSVSFVDGKRYYDTRSSYATIRRLSDMICEEYGLSVIREKPTRKKINYDNYFKGSIRRLNYYTIAKEDLDRAIMEAYNYEDFENLMRCMNYTLTYRVGKLSIRKGNYKRNIRVERMFGEDYSKDNIIDRISKTYSPREPFIEEYGTSKRKVYAKDYKKHKGIVALYLHYCYLLGVFKPKERFNKLTPEMRLEVYKMERYSEETRLLVRENIETHEQFFAYKKNIEDKYIDLVKKNKSLWYEHKKVKTSDEKENILKQIENLNNDIIPLKNEYELCKKIEEDIDKISDNLKKQEKEMIKNEFIRSS